MRASGIDGPWKLAVLSTAIVPSPKTAYEAVWVAAKPFLPVSWTVASIRAAAGLSLATLAVQATTSRLRLSSPYLDHSLYAHMSSLRCGQRQRWSRGPPSAARMWVPPRSSLDSVPLALSKATLKPSPVTVTVSPSWASASGFVPVAAATNAGVVAGSLNWAVAISKPCFAHNSSRASVQETPRKYSAPGLASILPNGTATNASACGASSGIFRSPLASALPSSLSVQATLNPPRVMNWYLFLIEIVPAARSAGLKPIHW